MAGRNRWTDGPFIRFLEGNEWMAENIRYKNEIRDDRIEIYVSKLLEEVIELANA